MAVVFLFAVLSIVSIFGLSAAVTGIIAGAGFAGIVVGLAAQGVLGNIFSGISLMFSRPYRLGDALLYHNDFAFVEDIKLMNTVLRTWDNRRIIVPNSVIDKEPLINYTIKDPNMIAPIFFSVSYESDIDRASEMMIDELGKSSVQIRSDGAEGAHDQFQGFRRGAEAHSHGDHAGGCLPALM